MVNYRCAEAFCLMHYQSDDGTEDEWIWNSRDGTTPFVVRSRSGSIMRHIDWHMDKRVPDHQPAPGDRIFVDMPPRQCERWGVPYGSPTIKVVE